MPLKIGIVGAGSIGCFVGGCLMLAGRDRVDVTLYGRESMGRELLEHGLHISDFRDLQVSFAADTLRYTSEPSALADLDWLIVTVKSGATAEVGEMLASCIKPEALIVSLQNGVGNAEALAAHLPNHCVLPGMVAFNVLQRGEGRFHAGTDGAIIVQDAPGTTELGALFADSGMPFQRHHNMVSVLWSKLLFNLNNPLNALSGIPLKEELSQRAYRRCLAALQREAIVALGREGIPLEKLTVLPTRLLPSLLEVPDWMFTRLAQKMLAIDPLARSSMWEDLERGRITEVDWLNAEVVRLAEKHGLDARANRRIVELIRLAEQGGRRDFRGDELLAELKSA